MMDQTIRARGTPDPSRERGCDLMNFTDLRASIRARFLLEEAQTMAEYGVVLAVITLGILTAIAALSGGITNVINSVTSILP
jgi:Flp pilus assembly pilin Flp